MSDEKDPMADFDYSIETDERNNNHDTEDEEHPDGEFYYPKIHQEDFIK